MSHEFNELSPDAQRQAKAWQRLLHESEQVDAFTRQRLRAMRATALDEAAAGSTSRFGIRGLLASTLAACAVVVLAAVLLFDQTGTASRPSLEALQWASEDDSAHDLYRNLDIYEWMDRVVSEPEQQGQEQPATLDEEPA